MKRLFLAAVLAGSALAAPAPAAAQPRQDIKKAKVGGVKLKDVDNQGGRLKDGKLKTPFGKAKVSKGRIRLKL